MKNYWEKAVSYEEYMAENEKKAEFLKSKTDEDSKTQLHYYELGLTRMKRLDKTYKPQPELIDVLSEKKFKGKLLIISEGWCGDASMIIPVIHYFFKDKNEVRIIYRDENEDLINQFLTNGAKAIPIVLILNENNEVDSHWGPRTEQGTELLKRYKADPENYDAETFHNDLQIYYTKNKGFDIINELLERL